MARFVEKTFQSLNSVLNQSGLFQTGQDKSITRFQFQWVSDLDTFSNRLKLVESKQEEEETVVTYLTTMEKRLADPDVSNAEVESMVKLCMICESMGYPAPFIYIHSLKLAQKGNLKEKHTGYSAASYFLHPHHELVILLINTMQKDLCSSNIIEVILALTSVCNLISSETVHNILHLVGEKLNHKNSSVRKLAILTFGHCLRIADNQNSYQMSFIKIEKALTDSELEVVCVAVRTMYNVIVNLKTDFTYLISSLVELHDQVLMRRIPSSMNYCDIPAPWLQIDILKLLSFLCKSVEEAEKISPVLKKTLQQIGLNNTLAHAVMYQAIETATCVTMPPELSECVLSSVSTFLKSKDLNFKLTGIEALVLIMKTMKPSISSDQQETVMECLNFPDETLQFKTLELLYQLANPSNIQAICKKMIEFLVSVEDVDKKKQLALKILQIASKYIDRHNWYVSIVNTVFIEAQDLLLPTDVLNIINIIVKDNALKEAVRKSAFDLIKQDFNLTSCSAKLFLSVLSKSAEFLDFLPLLLNDDLSNWFCVSLMHTILENKEMSSNFDDIYEKLKDVSEVKKQAIFELVETFCSISNFKKFDPNVEVDPSLTFLDHYVLDSLETTSLCYLPPSYRAQLVPVTHSTSDFENISFSASSSEISCIQNSENNSYPKSPAYNAFSSPSLSCQSLVSEKDFPSTSTNKVVWTKDGRKSVLNEDSSCAKTVENPEEQKSSDKHELFSGVS